MIRLLHTSDWHLGRLLYGKSLLEDQEHVLAQLLSLIDKTRPHALLIAGDVFDRPLPPEAAVATFDRFLSSVVLERGLPVFLIPGNHDSCERLGFASRLLRQRGLTIFARTEDAFSPVTLTGDDGAEALVYGIPFVEPPLIGRALNRDDIRTPDEAVGSLCRALMERHDSSKPAILLCHAFVMGGESSESEKDIFIGGSSHVDTRSFAGFAYTALGHLHKPQRAGSETIRYSGSLLRYSKSEVEHVKSVTEVRLDRDGRCEIELHQLPCLRDLRYIEGEIDQVLRCATEDPKTDDYIIVGLTDPGPVLDAFARLRMVYPNLLHVSRAGGFVPTHLPALEKRLERQTVNELDLFAEFYRETTGTELESKEIQAIVDAIRSVDAAEGERA